MAPKYTKSIICPANSRKTTGRCVAGGGEIVDNKISGLIGLRNAFCALPSRSKSVRTFVERTPDARLSSSLGTATAAFDARRMTALTSALTAERSAPPPPLGIADAIIGDAELLMGATTLRSISTPAHSDLLLVTLLDGHYSIVARELIAAETRFAEMAQSLPHLAAARSRSTKDLALRLSTPARAGLLEVVVADRTWPGCSPFVDPHRVRVCSPST